MPYQAPVLVRESDFGKDEYKELCEFIEEKVLHLDKRLDPFRTETLPEYVRLYKGKPKNKEVEWPWPGASNLVIQLVGTYSDELLARIMGGIYMYDPLWTATLSGDTPDNEGEEYKQLVSNFMMDMAYDPNELDLYRVEQSAFHSAIKYGTGMINTPHEFQEEVEMVYVGGGESAASNPTGDPRTITKRDGPHPELLPLNRFGFEPNVPNLGNMKFFYKIESLDYWDVKNLPGKSPYYKKEDIDALLTQPDAAQETEMEKEITSQFSFGTSGIDKGAARWYIYECCFSYRKGGVNFSMIAKYHKRSRKVLYVTYNNYPKNIFPYEDIKLAYDDECYLGTGFAEMLHTYQKELSNNTNWRANNRNYAMLGAFRVSPESKLSSIIEMYPGVALLGKEGEIENLKVGADVGYDNSADEFIMSCAKERAGVDPATGGAGGGIVNPKRGIYSAAGTSMVLMQQNNRNNLRMSDMRSAHVRLGIKLLQMYSTFGLGSKIAKYGKDAEKLKKALDLFKSGTLGLRLRPSSASMNKELERQNDILLSDRMERFYQSQAQMIAAIKQQGAPPELTQYYTQALIAGTVLMRALLRNFNKDNVDALIPQVKSLLQQGQPNGTATAPDQNGGGFNFPSNVPQGTMGVGRLPIGNSTPM